jgi:hypothetical protein
MAIVIQSPTFYYALLRSIGRAISREVALNPVGKPVLNSGFLVVKQSTARTGIRQ